jgi:imidazolonepropionase-like amidohydrolase
LPGTGALAAQHELAPTAEHAQLSMQVYYGNRPRTEAAHKVATWGPLKVPSPAYAFKAARVLPIEGDPIEQGVVLTKDGDIVAVGKASDIPLPEGYEIVDCGDAWLFPGLVDLHNHISSPSQGDINDTVHATNPEFRTVDLITMDHRAMRMALAGGVTSALYIPGSGSNMGGFGTLTKTAGKSPEEALIRFPGSLKIAQAGNPERGSGDLGAGVLGMNQGLRFTLQRGYEYYKAWEDFDQGKGKQPEYRADLHYLRGLFRHEYPISVHTQIYQVVLQTIRQLRLEFGLWTFVDHGEFDAYRMSDFAAESGVAIVTGPRNYHFDNNTCEFIGLAAAWSNGGQHGWRTPVRGVGRDGIGLNTDSPVVPQEQLPVQAAIAVRFGLDDATAIRALTINPARIAGIDHRVGSLKPGKDADLAAWSGDPIDPRSHVQVTVVNGRIVYRRNPDRPLF